MAWARSWSLRPEGEALMDEVVTWTALPVPEMILEQARRTPDALALTSDAHQLTYGELAERSARLAAGLLAHGVAPGHLVAVALPRSAELIAVLLAVWRCGAAYVPIDVRYPAERRRLILADSGATALVTDELAGEDTDLKCLDPTILQQAAVTRTGKLPEASPDSLAYVIYTSGSTGRPKGVLVDHENLRNFVVADPRLDIRSGQVVGALAPVSFDASVFELWSTLAHGATVAMFTAETVSIDALGAFLRRMKPDWVFLASGLLHLLIEHDLKALAHVDTLITGGDVLSPVQVARAAAVVRSQLMAAYGPTETTVFASLHIVDAAQLDERVPIGSPAPGTVLRVLDENLAEVTAGEVGALFISGPGVSRGYLNRPDLTEGRFVVDPFSDVPGTRMYASGDRAREATPGVFEFHGRVDRQVKIRGFRVELEEIEALALAHSAVTAAAAEVFDDGAAFKRVALFVSLEAGSRLGAPDLRLWLADRLPPFMLPSAISLLPELPLNANGKVDRGALPYPWRQRSDVGVTEPYAPPQNAVEQAMATAWADVLGLDRVGRNDNFFEVGGDSLRSVALVARLAQEGIAVQGEHLLDHQTIAELAVAARPGVDADAR
jgi:amino acid adenylation domain-containing protein